MTEEDMGAQQADGLSQAEPVSRLGPSGFDPSRLRLERYDDISARIIDQSGNVFAIVEQLSNYRWIITDFRSWRRLCPTSFTSKGAALAWFRYEAIAMEARSDETEGLDPKDDSAGLEEASHKQVHP